MAGETISIKAIPCPRGTRRGVSLGDWYSPMLDYLIGHSFLGETAEAKENLRFHLSESCLWCIAVANSYLVVGYANLELENSGRTGVLAQANVDKGFRRRGIYKELVQLRIEDAIKRDVEEITIEPVYETTGYFEKLGFVVERTKPDCLYSLKIK